MVLYLIRHGQTAWNAQSKVMGRTDVPLDEIGEKQAIELAGSILHFPISKIYSSPQLRAQQTAQKIALKKNIPVVSDDLLSEIDFRRWVGKVSKELLVDEVYLARKKNFFDFDHPEVESYRSVEKRCKTFIESMGSADEHIAVVSHADIVRTFIVALMNMPQDMFYQFKVQNASCTVFKQIDDKWTMELLNFTPNPLQALDI